MRCCGGGGWGGLGWEEGIVGRYIYNDSLCAFVMRVRDCASVGCVMVGGLYMYRVVLVFVRVIVMSEKVTCT